MIVPCDIYVVGRSFIPIECVSPGDRVYSLNNGKPEITRVDSITSVVINGRINSVKTGLQQIEASDDTRYLYKSDINGLRYIAFNQIERLTPNKEYIPNKFLPVLSMPDFKGIRGCSDQEIEYLARMLVRERTSYDRAIFFEISSRMTGDDAFIFIDVLEHWCSETPGVGIFGKLNRKSRAFFFHHKEVCDEISRLACLTGYCTMFNEYEGGYVLQVFFEGIPIPGRVPKTEKYTKKQYYGNLFNLNAKNRPIFGRFGSRSYYLPCTSVLNEGV